MLPSADNNIIVVIGDVHSRVRLARAALVRLEADLQRRIDQVISVGDLGLFLDPGDWDYLTGPKRHRHPERCPEIQEAWGSWPWPLAMVAGNHEPFHRLRMSGGASFGDRLRYMDAGELPVQVSGLRVAGISGIHHGSHLAWPPGTTSWPAVAAGVREGIIGRKHLTYYRQRDLDVMERVSTGPEILVTHDWPMQPPGTRSVYPRRPEGELLERLAPRFHFAGHWHRTYAAQIATTEFRALNIITETGAEVLPGWAYVLAHAGGKITDLGPWPTECVDGVLDPAGM